MSQQLKGSETEKNLLKSFAGESQARNRYTYFASRAKKEGFMQISAIFEETANQEREHALRFFKYLEGGTLAITAEFPAGAISNTAGNLAEAAAGEYDEWHNLYPSFAAIARAEGFGEIAKTWDAICVSEKHHEKDTAPCSIIWIRNSSFNAPRKSSGNAATADISTTEIPPPKSAPPASTQKPTLNS